MPGSHMREGLGEGVDFGGVQAEGATDVADRVTHSIGLHHRHARHPVVAEAFADEVVDLQPACGLHVDIDIR